jgi:choline monooxygenase
MISNHSTEAIRSPLPLDFYKDPKWFDHCKNEIFPASWQFLVGPELALQPGDVQPFNLLPGFIDEPLINTRDKNGTSHILSNVCTHRGNLLLTRPGNMRQITCEYHGRCFNLDGSCLSQPGLKRVAGFPGHEDALGRPFATGEWAGLQFLSLKEAACPFESWMQPIRQRTDFLPWDELTWQPMGNHTFDVAANWALYVDNYLEGLHIPFVHPALKASLNLEAYPIELFPWGSVQIGLAAEGQAHFELPVDHPDFGQKIYAWYFWLFPNTMINVYPWGLSLNIVEPLSVRETRVRFLTYAFHNAGKNRSDYELEQTELEDEKVVEQVQKGTMAHLYKPGKLVPEWEKTVVHFHELLLNNVGADGIIKKEFYP